MTQYFNARTWSAFGMNLEQVRYLQELTDKLNTVETGATGDPTDSEVVTAYNAEVDVVTQALAEAGASDDVYRWTPERVAQAIAALSPRVTTGQDASASVSIPATAGRTLIIFGSGAWGNDTTAQTLTLVYNGNTIATQAVQNTASADDRTALSLIGRVTAVASTTCEILASGGTLYDPVITWQEI